MDKEINMCWEAACNDEYLVAELQKKMQSIKEQIRFLNVEAIYSYDAYTTEVAILITSIARYHDALYYGILLDSLIQQGTFSENGSFRYNVDVHDKVDFYDGINVITGVGVCRHISGFIDDVINKTDKSSKTFHCYESSDVSDDTNKGANHVINLLMHGKKLIGYDPTDHALYYFVDGKTMCRYYPDNSTFLHYRKHCEFMFCSVEYKYSDMITNAYDSFKYNLIHPIKFVSLRKKAYRDIANNMDIINEFGKKNKDLVRKIAK